jgi:hypothetical protein
MLKNIILHNVYNIHVPISTYWNYEILIQIKNKTMFTQFKQIYKQSAMHIDCHHIR